MSTAFKSSLTILFEAPFWIGLYERTDSGKYEVCKITFGSEPKDYEVYEFLLKNWHKLKFSPPIQAEVAMERKINPKRMQREIQKGKGRGQGGARSASWRDRRVHDRARIQTRDGTGGGTRLGSTAWNARVHARTAAGGIDGSRVRSAV